TAGAACERAALSFVVSARRDSGGKAFPENAARSRRRLWPDESLFPREMNLRRLICALLGLAFGLIFYLAWRSDHTLSNRLVNFLGGHTVYLELKQEFRHWLPLPIFLRGCLPSALWCFIATSLVGGWKIHLGGGRVLELAWLAPFFNAGWEGVQWIGWTD